MAGKVGALGLLVCVLLAEPAAAGPLTLVDQGKTRVCVVVPARAIPPKGAAPDPAFEHHRLAAKDLADYLGKMSGAAVPVGDKPAAGLVPIYVGAAPEKVPLSKKSDFGDAYLIDVRPDRVVLDGESAHAVHYAAARLLHALGVRWYGPDEMGEHVPRRKTLAVPTGRTEEAPHFQTRNLGSGDWGPRNRIGRAMLAQGHAFYGLMDTPKLFKEHPDYYPVVNGKPYPGQANLSNPKVVELFVQRIGAEFRKGPTSWAGGKSFGIGPDDGLLLDERPESRATESGEADPIFRVPSATDRFVKFANAVALGLEKEFPDHTLGFYVYSNHNFPPRMVKPHRNLVPVVAPIAFNRYLSIGNPNEATSMLLKDNILAWKALTSRLGVYLYNYNLADTAMPFTRRLAWSKDLPNLYRWGVRDCTIESMANWHTMVPGNYVVANLLWDVHTDVPALLDEFYADYYGPAGPAMRAYNALLEDAYESTHAFAGCTFSMHRIFTPERTAKLEAALARAVAAAKGDALIARRVGVTRHSLNFARHWLAMRGALNRFRLAEAERHAQAFLDEYAAASRAYPAYFVNYIESYFRTFHHRSFAAAGRVARAGTVVYQFPDEWAAFLDESKAGEKMGLHLPGAGLGDWTRLRTYSASLDEQGQPFFRGLIWYRHEFELPAEGRNARALKLWLGGTDDAVHAYLNGKDLGSQAPGNFGPSEFDLTAAVNRTGRNVLVLAVDNSGITELGTGGLVRPALIYAPK
jgi:hypothetical protein